MFSGNLYSFQKGIGILDLLKAATKSIDDGKEYVVEVDIKSYFENINHDVLEKQLLSIFQDKNFVDLIMIFHKCSIIKDGLTRKNKKGLITGSSLGPI